MTSDEFIRATDDITSPVTWYHFEGRIPETTLKCIHYLRFSNPLVKISVEVEKPGRPGLDKLAAEADVVFYSRSWAQYEGHKDAEQCLRAQTAKTIKAQLLCCTWGSDGVTAIDLPGNNSTKVPAFQPKDFEIVDSTGAGDTFIAGMLFGLICRPNWSLNRKLTFANELAGRKVAQEGFSGLADLMIAHWDDE